MSRIYGIDGPAPVLYPAFCRWRSAPDAWYPPPEPELVQRAYEARDPGIIGDAWGATVYLHERGIMLVTDHAEVSITPDPRRAPRSRRWEDAAVEIRFPAYEHGMPGSYDVAPLLDALDPADAAAVRVTLAHGRLIPATEYRPADPVAVVQIIWTTYDNDASASWLVRAPATAAPTPVGGPPGAFRRLSDLWLQRGAPDAAVRLERWSRSGELVEERTVTVVEAMATIAATYHRSRT